MIALHAQRGNVQLMAMVQTLDLRAVGNIGNDVSRLISLRRCGRWECGAYFAAGPY